ncbi:MAG: STAS domain-containing protein [Alphaproteobacteria bacterium]|nr:STAS domain-containing protein [Alphaproteobacteria bacterium]
MQVSVRTASQQREFFIKGDFTAQDEKRFFDVFVQIRSMTEPQLAFNLAQCTFIDSAAMGMLVVAFEEAAKRNIFRLIRQAPASLEGILRSAGFDRFCSFQ